MSASDVKTVSSRCDSKSLMYKHRSELDKIPDQLAGDSRDDAITEERLNQLSDEPGAKQKANMKRVQKFLDKIEELLER